MPSKRRSSKAGIVLSALVTAAGVAVFAAINVDRLFGTTFTRSIPGGVALASPFILIGGIAWLVGCCWGHRFADSDASMRPRDLFTLCLWFGLAAGLGEVATEAVRTAVAGVVQPPVLDPYGFHVIPLTDLMLFVVFGLLAVVLPSLMPRTTPAFAAGWTCACATFAFMAPLWRFNPSLDSWASLILALGLGYVTTRAISSRAGAFRRLVRRTVLWPIVALTAAWVWIYVPKTLQSDPAQQITARDGAPNVLLIVLDTVRADALGSYGNERPTTPNLDRFAAHGVRFEWALSTSPWTLPSHASMFTGRYPHEVFRADETPLSGSVPFRDEHATLAEVLSRNGYSTAGFVGNKSYCSYIRGIDRGFFRWDDYQLSPGVIFSSSGLGIIPLFVRHLVAPVAPPYSEFAPSRKSARDINEAFLGWLSQHQHRPFFAFLNYFDAHSPYVLPEPGDPAFYTPPGIKRAPSFVEPHTDAQLLQMRAAYDECVAYLDARLGELLAELEHRGTLDNTLVLITSDHGEQFGEHGLVYHSSSLYRPLLHVPLMVSWPGHIPAGQEPSEVVSLRDMAATVVELLGIEGSPFPGTSWAHTWNHGSPPDDPIHLSELLIGDRVPSWLNPTWPVSKGGMKAANEHGMHLIRRGDGEEEMYDLRRDPREQRDLIDEAEHAAVAARLRAWLDRIW